MKKLISLIMSVMMILTLSVNAFAGTSQTTMVNGAKTRIPMSIGYKDFKHMLNVAQEVSGQECVIVNAQKYNGDKTTWIVRIVMGESMNDYVCTTIPYTNVNGSITSLPFNSVEEGTTMYSPNWYYSAMYDDNDHNICGYMITSRIKRWSDWGDLTFNGADRRNVNYVGSYVKPNSATFLEELFGVGEEEMAEVNDAETK